MPARPGKCRRWREVWTAASFSSHLDPSRVLDLSWCHEPFLTKIERLFDNKLTLNELKVLSAMQESLQSIENCLKNWNLIKIVADVLFFGVIKRSLTKGRIGRRGRLHNFGRTGFAIDFTQTQSSSAESFNSVLIRGGKFEFFKLPLFCFS